MDISIVENSGNGGNIVVTDSDIQLQGGYGNMMYLALFGGQYEAVTTTNTRKQNEILSDFWGNSLLELNNLSNQNNSNTERILQSVPLNSFGRIKIENAIKQDLEFMQKFATFTIAVAIISDDVIKISIKIRVLENAKAIYKELIIIYNVVNRLGDFSLNDFNDDFKV
jgi:hypothetical protein